MRTIEVGSDFSGVGAFNYAVKRVAGRKGFKVDHIFACDIDKFVRQSYLKNHGHPLYYPKDVYTREIPEKSLDVYVTSPPCQAFSQVGSRKGKQDHRGVLFFNSHAFIAKNKPRYFIFENVEGLLSHDKPDKKLTYGRTFSEWVNMLGGKSINGAPVIFPAAQSVPYHIYYKVLNAKEHGVPQNRKRVFIVGVRDNEDNTFTWPVEEQLKTSLKDVLEPTVDKKYFLSKKMVRGFLNHADRHSKKGNGFGFAPTDPNKPARSITTNSGSRNTDNFLWVQLTEARTEEAKRQRSENMKKGVGDTLRLSKKLVPRTDGVANTITATQTKEQWLSDGSRIRKLTPRECFRIQDFPNTFDFVVSDTQLYKQAGNSIPVRVLEKIIDKLHL